MRRSRPGARVRAGLGVVAAVTAVAVAAPPAHAAPSAAGPAAAAAAAPSTPDPKSPAEPKAPKSPNAKPLTADEPAAAAAAEASGKDQPIPSLTTTTSRVLVKPGGGYRLESFARPVRVKQGTGWADIDTTLIRRADGTVGPKASAGGAVFSGGGDGPAVTIANGDKKISVSWPAPLPAPVLDGPAATYRDVLPGVDLVLTATDSAYSEVLVVKDATAAANPALKAVHLRVTGTGVTVRTAADGALTAVDAQGKETFHAPAATMWDSTSATGTADKSDQAADKPSPLNPGSGKVTKLKTSTADAQATKADASGTSGASGTSALDVTLSAPDGSLTGPGVHYPVFIDPWFTGWNTYWISISNKGFDSTYNSGSETRVGYCGWTDCNYDTFRTYFDMNIDGIQPRNGVKPNLTSAWFYITQDHVGGCTAQPTIISESGWVDGGTTWPGPLGRDLDTQSSDAGGNSSCPKSAQQIGFNVTSGLQDAIWYNWQAFTFALRAQNESDRNQWKKFWNNPHLDVDYDYPPGAPGGQYVSGEFTCNGKTYVTNNTNFTVNAVAWDNNPSPLPLKYWFEVLNSSGTRMSWNWNYAPVQTSSGAYGSWQTNYGTFPNGDYTFRTTVENVPQNDPAPPSWAYTNASGENDGNYSASIGNAPTHAFTVLNETMPSPTVKSFDYPKDSSGNPVWGLPQGVNGQFVFGNAANTNTAGYSYAIDSGGSVDGLTNDICSYDSQRSAGGAWYGLISDSGGKAALTLPAGLSVGHHTLWVKSFDGAHNMSPTATRYEFFIAPNYNAGPVKFEAEDTAAVAVTTSAPAPAAAPATSVQNWSADSWSGGKQLLLAGREVGDKFTFAFNTGIEAYYALGIGLSKSADYGKLTFDIDGTALRADAAPINGYSAALATAHISLGGVRLKPGRHKLTLTVAGTDALTANSTSKLQYQAGVDYLSATPVNGVAFSSFGAAMNNHGFSDDTATSAGNLDYSVRNANGDVGGTGTGSSLSRQALAAAGLAPGTAFTLSGMNFTMPDAVKDASGNVVADNVVAMGQTISVDPAQRIQANAVGLLVASTCGTTPPSGATVGYANGLPAPDSPATSGVPDWTTGTAQTAAYTLPYRNGPSGKDATAVRLYLLVLPTNPGGVLDSVTLPYPGPAMVPGTCPTALHVLAVGVRPAATANLASSADTSGNNHPLTLAGNLGFSTDRGGAAVFSGQSGQAAKTGSAVLDTTKSFTVSAWAKPAPGAVNGVVATQDGTNTGAFMLYLTSTGTWKFAMQDADAAGWNADAVETTTKAAGNTWAHLVGVYDASAATLSLYVNGTLVGTQAHANPWAAAGPFALGRDKVSGAFNAQFSGAISGVRAYQRALSASDVSALFGGNAPTGAAGIWALNDFGRSWVGAWAASPSVGATAAGGGTLFSGQTVRQVVHPTTYGTGANAQVRVRLSNRFGTAPLTVTTASAARAGAAGTAAAGTAVPLTFGGAGVASVTIKPGAEVFSDPIAVSALGGSASTGDLAVSFYLASGAGVAAETPQAAAVGFTASGDQTADTAGSGSTWTALASKGYYLLSGVDVTSTDTTQGTVAVLGDQGSAAAPGVPAWSDDLPGALSTAGVTSPGGVVNLSAAGGTAAGLANSLNQRLAGWWRLADGTTGADLVGGHPLTLSGTATASTDHPSTTTGSVQFDGTSSVGLTSGPVLDTSQSFTVSAWAKLSSLPADNREVVAVEGTSNSSFMLGYQGSTQAWWVFMPWSDAVNPGGTVVKANPNSAQANVWTHLTATYDSITRTVKLYVNGTLAGSASSTTGFKASGSLAVGRSTWNTYKTDYWPGNIADVQTFQQSLPGSDVAVLANGGGSDLQAGNLLNAGALDEPNLRTVVLALGAGDLAHGDTAATVEANLRSLATDIKTGLKMYKGPNGDYQINVVVETVPAQGWPASDPREQARLALNSDILNGTVGDGASDGASAVAGAVAGGGDAGAVQAAIAQRLAQDAASFAVTL